MTQVSDSRLCEGRVAVVTGAGRGIGREHALSLAAAGASVVVNDRDEAPAKEVVAEIEAAGGAAVASTAEIADFEQAGALIDEAVRTFGRLDVLINNAGILRDRTIASMTEDEFDDVVAVHLKGHFCPTRHAAAYWRERSKAGEQLDARIINTASPSGLFGNAGQANYGAAKAGIAAMTLVEALELGRYGVTANCLAPTAITRLVAPVMGGEENISAEIKERLAPRWVAAVATWLASPASRGVTGRVFDVRGDRVAVVDGWHRGAEGTNPGTPEGVGAVLADLVAKARPNADLDGYDDPKRFRLARGMS